MPTEFNYRRDQVRVPLRKALAMTMEQWGEFVRSCNGNFWIDCSDMGLGDDEATLQRDYQQDEADLAIEEGLPACDFAKWRQYGDSSQ